MTDVVPPSPSPSASPSPPGPRSPLPMARVSRRRQFQLVWLIPIVALAIGGFLAWRAVSQRGPDITIQFETADGLVAGQTKVKHKSVELGSVTSITLSPDDSHVLVGLRMQREATSLLTENARFWVVRPHLGVGGISGLETLLSGAYISVDTYPPGGAARSSFIGLENPPAVRSDEPGHTYILTAKSMGGLSVGAPVFYRDIVVGEVINTSLAPSGDGVVIRIFIRRPYDDRLSEGSVFWNASGFGVELTSKGVELRLQSLQALLAGGLAFDTMPDQVETRVAPEGFTFNIFPDRASAQISGLRRRVQAVMRVQMSVRGLTEGAAVEMFGIQVGVVTSVHLEMNPPAIQPYVLVGLEVQPERMRAHTILDQFSPTQVARMFVSRGLHATIDTGSLLTGQKVVSLHPGKPGEQVPVEMENGLVVVPTTLGGLDGITDGAAEFMKTLNALPLAEIGRNVSDMVAKANGVAKGPELHQALQSLASMLAGADTLVHKLDAGASPLAKRLPEMAQSLQTTLDRAIQVLKSVDNGYGENSGFHRDLMRVLGQANDTARSLRVLADFLDRHPEAVLRGRTEEGGK